MDSIAQIVQNLELLGRACLLVGMYCGFIPGALVLAGIAMYYGRERK